MARGDKNYDKITHELVKGKGKTTKEKQKKVWDMIKLKEQEKKQILQKMIEALIADKSEEAATALHSYLKLKTREILVGEDVDDENVEASEEKEEDRKEKTNKGADEEKSKADKEEKKEEKEVKKDDKKDPDAAEEEEEAVSEADWSIHHPAGSFSRKVDGKVKYKNGGQKTLLKHTNAAPELDSKIDGDVNFSPGGSSKALKHTNAAPELKDEVKGNFFKK